MPTIDCEKIAKKILAETEGGTLVILRNNDDPSATSYVRQLIKLSRKTQTEIIEENYNSTWLVDGVVRLIDGHNEDPDVSGIVVVSPEPSHYEALSHISLSKRVEGTDFDDNPERVSCTARACIKIIESITEFDDKNILVIGYGKTVGKPLSYLLMRMHAASVTTTHQYTKMEEIFNEHIPKADIIISAVGCAYLIQGDYKDKIFIDAGISVLDGQICGDIHPSLCQHNEVTPVPGGVGPVTTALLLQNVSLAAQGKF